MCYSWFNRSEVRGWLDWYFWSFSAYYSKLLSYTISNNILFKTLAFAWKLGVHRLLSFFSGFMVALNHKFFEWLCIYTCFLCLDFQKTVKSKRWQPGRPLMCRRQPTIVFPSGQSPFRLHYFFGNPDTIVLNLIQLYSQLQQIRIFYLY